MTLGMIASGVGIVGGLSSMLGGGGGGGGGGGQSINVNTGNSPLSSLIQGLFSGGGLAGIGPMSQQTINAAGAAADPFATQRAQYQPQLASTITGLMGAGAPQQNPALAALAGTSTMNPALAALGTSDPSMQFRYQTGLDALSRGNAATGNTASGRAMTELEQYGQNFASTEFQNMFQRQLGLQQATQGLQAQNFGQLSSLQGLSDQEKQQGIGNQQILAQLLGQLSGATTGNPAASGAILAGKYGQSQDTIANFLSSLNGMFGPGGLGSLIGAGSSSAPSSSGGLGGLSNLLGNLSSGGSSLAGTPWDTSSLNLNPTDFTNNSFGNTGSIGGYDPYSSLSSGSYFQDSLFGGGGY